MNEDIKEKKVKIARTRNGIPCLWESLVNFSDLKRASTVFSKDLTPKKAIYINPTKEKQALVPIKIGDYISKAFEDHHGIAISVFKILAISSMDNTATVLPVYRKSSLISEYTIPETYLEIVEMTIDKLSDEELVISEKSERLKSFDDDKSYE